MPCGLEPHQYDLHEHLFRGRHAGYIPLGRRMGALRLAGRRGCRSAAHRRLAVAHAPQRKIASAQSCPVRSAAVFRPYTRNPAQSAAGALAYPGRKPHRVRRAAPLLPLRPDTALSGYNRRLPPSPPGNAARGSQGPEKILMPPRSRHPPFCPMNSRSSLPCSGDRSACLRPGMPPGLSATESQTRFRTRLPLHRTLPAHSAGHPDPMSPPKARTTRKRPPKDTNSSIYQLIRLKFAGGGKLLSLYSRTPPKNSNHS